MICKVHSNRAQYKGKEPAKKIVVRSPMDAAEQFKEILKAADPHDQEKEHFWVLGLSGKNQTIRFIDLVSLGCLNASIVHPREVFRFAVLNACSSIIVGHNHPGGDPNPSKEDILITRRLEKAGTILGIDLVDHIIITQPAGYTSLKEGGYL